MNKGIKIKAARDIARTKACERIARKYKRSMDWAYKVSRRDPIVKGGEYYQAAIEDYEIAYQEIKQVLS